MSGRCAAVAPLAVALIGLLAAAPAVAQQPAPSGDGPTLELGLRTGFMLGFGDDLRGLSAATTSRYQSFLPLELDVGVRFASGLVLGAYLQYGQALGKRCATATTCSGRLIRFGADALFHARPRAPIDPWVGLGIGYEIGRFAQAPAGQAETVDTLRGLELFHLQAGLALPVATRVALGPFVMLALGRYTVATTAQGSLSTTADIRDQSLHELLLFGLRGTFELGP
ncbi:MAG: hypothetical protein NVSMB23_12340 [Myxococcales bacterium]